MTRGIGRFFRGFLLPALRAPVFRTRACKGEGGIQHGFSGTTMPPNSPLAQREATEELTLPGDFKLQRLLGASGYDRVGGKLALTLQADHATVLAEAQAHTAKETNP